MKRIAILVIAATRAAVHRHYLASYWTDLITRSDRRPPHIDVYVLNEHGTDRRPFTHLLDHVIEDPDPNPRRHLPEGFAQSVQPGILSKTIHALDVLGDRYDVFFRTNLSSMLVLGRFDRFVQSTPEVGYSGGWVWADALRADLVKHDRIGPGLSIRSMSELDGYPGNSFVSGSGFFLSADEARYLVDQRDRLRYDVPDDVAIGLMLEQCRNLPDFSESISATTPIQTVLHRISNTSATHIRLEHFPVGRAATVWWYLDRDVLWR